VFVKKFKNIRVNNNMTQQEKRLQMCLLMTPDMANFTGVVHGGAILKLLDQVAYACAAKYSKSYVVTASLDQVFFREHIKVGELVTFYAQVNYVGNSSMEIGIRVVAENLTTHQQRTAVTCFFTMVAVDEAGKPKKVTPLIVVSANEKRLFESAKLRKKMRQEILEQSLALQVDMPEGET